MMFIFDCYVSLRTNFNSHFKADKSTHTSCGECKREANKFRVVAVIDSMEAKMRKPRIFYCRV